MAPLIVTRAGLFSCQSATQLFERAENYPERALLALALPRLRIMVLMLSVLELHTISP